MLEPTKKEENPLAFLEKEKEEKPKAQVKKIAESLKQFAKRPNTPDKLTSRQDFLKRANSEKDPKKRRAIIAALRGRMFQ